MGVRIVVWDGEPISQARRRFRKKLEISGALWEARRRAYPADPAQERRAKRFQKRFKARQATLLAQHVGEQPVVSVTKAMARFWARTGKP